MLIHIGIDDTDTLDSPGTNQLARAIARALPPGATPVIALRHQLLFDPRVPFTSHNGCASLLVQCAPDVDAGTLLPIIREIMRARYVPGSDPGLCVAQAVPDSITDFGRRAQRDLVSQREARALAERAGVHLEGLGGTEDGVIGALAAVGLLASGEDGRVVDRAGWEWPDPFIGVQSVAAVRARGVDEIRDAATNQPVDTGVIDLGKRLRPSYRGGRVVLYVEAVATENGTRWRALKLP